MFSSGSRLEGWLSFPAALSKMRVMYQDRWINVCTPQCVAINDRGVGVYGPNKGRRRRMVHHILYHEQPLLTLMNSNVAALSRSPIGWPPVTWSWMRPAGVAPRQMARRQVELDPHANVEGTGQRFTARESPNRHCPLQSSTGHASHARRCQAPPTDDASTCPAKYAHTAHKGACRP